MAEWQFLVGWSPRGLRSRLQAVDAAETNFDCVEQEMTSEHGWRHYSSEAVIGRDREGGLLLERARMALVNYQFSDPAIVVAHFDPASALLMRRMLLEIKIFGLRYLCPAVVSQVRDEPGVYGFRYDTLTGHIERGVEWFLLTEDDRGDIRFRIEARWQHGDLPNWWSCAGFAVLAARYQREWHRRAHQRMSLLARYGSLRAPRADATGLTHQGVDVTFTEYTTRSALP